MLLQFRPEMPLSPDAAVAPIFIARVTGPSFSIMRGLRLRDAISLADDLVALQEAIGEEGNALSDALYDVIGAMENGSLKARLVGLRRAIHSRRHPDRGEFDEGVRHALPFHLRGRISSWTSMLDRERQLFAALGDTLHKEVTTTGASVLRDSCRDKAFQHGLLLANPGLFEEIDRWLTRKQDGLPRSKVLTPLIKYLARAVTKTSPYSTFTVSGLGRWTDHASAPAQFMTSSFPRSILEVNLAALERVANALALLLARDTAVPVSANPSTLDLGDSFAFLRRPPREPVTRVRATPAVRRALRLVGHREQITLDQLRFRLQNEIERGTPADIARFIQTLIDTGLIQPQIPVDYTRDFLTQLCEWLADAGTPRARATRTRLLRILKLLGRYPRVQEPAVRVHLRDRLHRELAHLHRDCALPFTDLTKKYALYENVIFEDHFVRCDSTRWRKPLRDLDSVRRLLGLFDPNLLLRLAAVPLFTERFGKGAEVPFLLFYEQARGELAALESNIDYDDQRSRRVPDPRAAEVYRLRGHLLDEIKQQTGETTAVVKLSPALVEDLLATFPEFIPTPASLAFYMQITLERGHLHLVVNGATVGHGRASNQVRRLVPHAGVDSSGWRPELSLPFIEVSGTFGSSLNQRPKRTAYELHYPFTVSSRPEDKRIRVSDLTVHHDEQSDLLVLKESRLGAEVRPVHLGLLSERLLPPMLQILIRVFGESSSLLHASRPLLTWERAQETDEFVGRLPRVDVGDVTIQRAAWIARAGGIPKRGAAVNDADYLVRMLAWLRRHRVPTECFARVIDRKRLATYSDPLGKIHKPLYVDFRNWFLTRAFDGTLRTPSDIVILQECLPPPGEEAAEDGVENRVTEYVIEISDLRRTQ
jgi:hypothetical protein